MKGLSALKWALPLLLAAATSLATAQTHCARGIRIVVPYLPGGGTDVLARYVAKAMGDELGTSVIVDNQPGGASLRGTQIVERAAADGCTIGMIDTAFTINAGLLPKLPFDTRKDFAPISMVASSPIILTVPAKYEAKNLQDLIGLAKKRPGEIAYGSAGVGTSGHLAIEDLSLRAKIKLIHVAYKGAGPAVTDLVGGHVSLAMIAPAGVIEQIRAGNLRPLAVTAASRVSSLPNTPTFAELGFPEVNAMSIWGLVAPAATPRPIIDRYQQIVAKHAHDKNWVELAEKLGMSLDATTPEAFSRFIAEDIKRWSTIVKAADVKPE